MHFKIKLFLSTCFLLIALSCSKESNSSDVSNDSGVKRFDITITQGLEQFDIVLSSSALDTKIIDLETGKLIPDSEAIGDLIQVITDSRAFYSLESEKTTINMSIGINFLEKEVSLGKPIAFDITCYNNDKLQDSYQYQGTAIALAQFFFAYTDGIGFQIISEPKN
ncbi:hypothetical protein [Maribacter sp.]|uniref:hypothetical protein n=1 Tax=Maribacter sp. TaxID=1897614 RepID=UPI0025BE6FD0|nr:hypothetical protein [Maribacter sp.]